MFLSVAMVIKKREGGLQAQGSLSGLEPVTERKKKTDEKMRETQQRRADRKKKSLTEKREQNRWRM